MALTRRPPKRRDLRRRVRELERLVLAMAARIAAASEVLSKLAERRDRRGSH